MASWLSFSQPIDVDVRLEGEDQRKQVEVKMEKERKENCPIYFDGEAVSGQASPLSFLDAQVGLQPADGRRKGGQGRCRRGSGALRSNDSS
jgi:hypothetical protein